MTLTKQKNRIHSGRKICYICKKGFSTDYDNKQYCKERDHCHYSGKYREAAHNFYNLR